jgi:UDP-N-acetylglucosamine 2-epimerase (non-hydrolysing)
VRENTERPVTASLGTNVLVGQNMTRLRDEVGSILAGKTRPGQVPPLWDGHAAERVAAVVELWIGSGHQTDSTAGWPYARLVWRRHHRSRMQ